VRRGKTEWEERHKNERSKMVERRMTTTTEGRRQEGCEQMTTVKTMTVGWNKKIGQKKDDWAPITQKMAGKKTADDHCALLLPIAFNG